MFSLSVNSPACGEYGDSLDAKMPQLKQPTEAISNKVWSDMHKKHGIILNSCKIWEMVSVILDQLVYVWGQLPVLSGLMFLHIKYS